MGQFSCRLHSFLAGLFWVNVEYVDADYKKWLGPSWTKKYTGSGTIIANHVCWMDILIGMVIFFPSFVSKKSIKKYPFVGMIATALDCVFLDRAGTKEEKIAVGK